jgi:hypothetical protein
MSQIIGKGGMFDAVAKGDTRTVLALVKNGTNPNTANKSGETPVWVAAKLGHIETVQALVERGAEVNTGNFFGETPLFIAASGGFTETVRALAARGADIDTASKFGGETPLFIAASNGHMETVWALVMLGADPVPALLTAALRADTKLTWRLVSECGVDPASRNRHGQKALDLVRAGSNEYKLLEWLEGLQNHPPDLGPGASRADKSLTYIDWFYHRGDAPCKEDNDAKRAAGFLCPVCQYTSLDGIACVPCGHRVCPDCWADMREQHQDKCPQCRAPIAHGEPQDSWSDKHPLYSRFCVEVPSAWR